MSSISLKGSISNTLNAYYLALPYAFLRYEYKILFCSTGLPLARTRWVWSAFSRHCPLSFNQGHWLTSATLIIFHLKKFRECWKLNPGLLGEKKICHLCAMHHPKYINLYQALMNWNESIVQISTPKISFFVMFVVATNFGSRWNQPVGVGIEGGWCCLSCMFPEGAVNSSSSREHKTDESILTNNFSLG